MTTILTKKKDTTGAPAPGDLTNAAGGAELAVNTFDKRLYTKDSGGNVVEIGTNPSIIDTTTVDTTNLEVTNIKAKDGTASATIANSTGIMTIGSSVLTTTDINGGTIDGTVIGGASAAAGNFTTLGATGVTTVQAGTVSAPAITTTGDTNTGIFFPAADTIAFTEGGAESMRIDSSGNMGIGTSSPASKLQVSGGNIRLDNNQGVEFGGSNNSIYGNETTDFVAVNTNGSERMRIDSSGNVGIGTSSPNTTAANRVVLEINATTSALLNISGGGTRRATFYADNTDCVFGSITSIPLEFLTGGAERMRIDSSGNVGIGTSSPATKAEISGTAAASNIALRITNTATDGYSTLQLGGDGAAGVYRNGSTQTLYGGANSLNLITVGAHNIGFSTGNTLRATINSSGNVGIGVTPSPHGVIAPGLDIGVGGALASYTNQFDMMFNSYYDGSNFRYKTTNVALNYRQLEGGISHSFETAPSGSAGATVTFTQRAIITPFGLGLGGAAPTSGMGITFPATQNASSDANTLDDYEEGTWTPSLGGNTTYVEQQGTYVKIGRMITLQGILRISTLGTGSTTLVTGLPFTSSANGQNTININYYQSSALSYTWLSGYIEASTSQFRISGNNGNAVTAGSNLAIFQNGTGIWFTATYFV